MRIMLILAATLLGLLGAPARAQQPPITIGFGMALTGGLAPIGKAALLAMQIWMEETNAKGGIIGRPVKLVYYDDRSNPATVPGIYTKLLDVDKVDLVVSGYATNMVAPAMPVIMQHNRTFLSLFGLAVNTEFNYPELLLLHAHWRSAAETKLLERLLRDGDAANPEAGHHRAGRRRRRIPAQCARRCPHPRQAGRPEDRLRQKLPAQHHRLHADRPRHPGHRPDLVFVASYPPDTVGMIRAAHEVGLKAKLFGGGMVGLQSTAIKAQLGPLLNGIVDYDFWLPWASFATPEAKDFLKVYQSRAQAAGVDALGYYIPPFAYGYMQVLQQAVEGTRSLDQAKLADYLRTHTFKTTAGDIKFAPGGEWAEAQVLEVQFRGLKNNEVSQFTDPNTEVILWPPKDKTGTVIYPYTDAQH